MIKKIRFSVVIISILVLLSSCPQEPSDISSEEDNYDIELPENGIGFVEAGDGNILYTGDILLPDVGIYRGQMLINEDGLIIYIGRTADKMPEASGATKITCAYGLAVPGFIDAWRHTAYAGGKIIDSISGERYEYRHQWRKGLDGHSAITFSNPGIQLWDEIGLIMTGTTTVMGTASTNGSSGLVRNLKSYSVSEGLMSNGDLNDIDSFPLGDIAGERSDILGYAYPELPSWPLDDKYVTYTGIFAEGISAEARNEFLTVSDTSGTPNTENILSERTIIVHGNALRAEDYKKMADAGSSLVWTPRSDLFLYGNTAMVTVFDRLGGNIALGSTWSVTGSINTLLEVQTAAFFNDVYLGHYFSDLDIINMATLNAAKAYKVDYKVGSLEVGKLADFTIFDTRSNTDFDAVFNADQTSIALVFRSGEPLYGDTYLIDNLRSDTENSETISIGSTVKRIYTIGEIGKTISQLEGEASTAPLPLVYDARSLNTNIIPFREGEYTGEITSSDSDGDGITDNIDNAPEVFNPIRPVDEGVQADSDGDGVGDVADPVPLP